MLDKEEQLWGQRGAVTSLPIISTLESITLRHPSTNQTHGHVRLQGSLAGLRELLRCDFLGSPGIPCGSDRTPSRGASVGDPPRGVSLAGVILLQPERELITTEGCRGGRARPEKTLIPARTEVRWFQNIPTNSVTAPLQKAELHPLPLNGKRWGGRGGLSHLCFHMPSR